MDNIFNQKEALDKLTQKINQIDWFRNAAIGSVHALDVDNFYGFSVMPQNSGKEGEVIYMVTEDRILTAGNEADFSWLMNELCIGKKENAISYDTFVNIFLRMKIGKQGVILNEINGHPLLKPGQIPENKFNPPTYAFNNTNANYSFWIFDTNRYVAVLYNVVVNANGQVTYQAIEY